MTLTFNPGQGTVMAHTHAKNQDQKPVGSKAEGVQTDGRTRPIADTFGNSGAGECDLYQHVRKFSFSLYRS